MSAAGSSTITFGPATLSLPYMCEMEISPECAARGPWWAYYRDTTGVEGHDSCVWVSPYALDSWSEASASCPSGSHLATAAASTSDVGFLPFAASVAAGGTAYMGCSQSFSSYFQARGWSWVDGTDASNLNCRDSLSSDADGDSERD